MIYYYFRVYYKTFESDRMACVTDVICGCTSIQQAEDKCIRKQRKLLEIEGGQLVMVKYVRCDTV